jgi:hypothetical protein
MKTNAELECGTVGGGGEEDMQQQSQYILIKIL